MKTEVEIRDDLLDKALKYSELLSKEAVVEKALEEYVYSLLIKKVDEFRGPGVWEGDLNQMRTSDLSRE
ncbi:MAG: type II toxin-antitoxin system VapB family antitoxin [Cytophagaceae bacterium]|nr:type II toxin-antitoxin system VapB family antitoxin [Cytophagaceae bacterium]